MGENFFLLLEPPSFLSLQPFPPVPFLWEVLLGTPVGHLVAHLGVSPYAQAPMVWEPCEGQKLASCWGPAQGPSGRETHRPLMWDLLARASGSQRPVLVGGHLSPVSAGPEFPGQRLVLPSEVTPRGTLPLCRREGKENAT